MTTISKMAMECSIQINNESSDFITETVNEALGKKKITINAKKQVSSATMIVGFAAMDIRMQ